MNTTPSNELKTAVENVTDFQDQNTINLIEWLRLIAKMEYGACLTSSHLIEKLEDPKMWANFDEDEPFLLLHIDLTPWVENDSTVITLTFEENDIAFFDAQPFTFGGGEFPESIKDKIESVYGFKGSWEEVMNKWVELQNTVCSYEPPLIFPKVPEEEEPDFYCPGMM